MRNRKTRNKIRYVLHNLDNIDELIQHLETDINRIRDMEIEYCSTSVLSDMPRGSGGNKSKVETAVVKRLDYIGRLEEELMEKINLRKKITEVVLLSLTANERQVYEMRFRNKENGDISFKEIAAEMDVTYGMVQHYENAIITKLERVW